MKLAALRAIEKHIDEAEKIETKKEFQWHSDSLNESQIYGHIE